MHSIIWKTLSSMKIKEVGEVLVASEDMRQSFLDSDKLEEFKQILAQKGTK